MEATADSFDFSPPPGRRWRGPAVLALFIHGLLVIALTWGISWNENPQVVAEAELWSALPKVAAPHANEPDEPPPPPQAEKTAPPPPEAQTPPPVPATPQRTQAEIALEKKKKEAEQRRREEELQLQRQREAEAKKKAELKKQEALKKQRETDALAEKKKREAEQVKQKEREKAAKDKAAKEKTAKDKAAAEQKKKDDTLRKAEDARRDAQLEADRKKNLERMMGLAGASGGATAQGKDLQSSGPSASYGGKLVARIKPNIVFTDSAPGNPRAEVEVRALPDGTIVGRKLLKSSGHAGWDEAVLRAIDRTATLPKDENGKVPGTLVLGFRPLD